MLQDVLLFIRDSAVVHYSEKCVTAKRKDRRKAKERTLRSAMLDCSTSEDTMVYSSRHVHSLSTLSTMVIPRNLYILFSMSSVCLAERCIQ